MVWWGRIACPVRPVDASDLSAYVLRGERNPAWAGHLDTNPRAFLKRGLRFLAAAAR